VKGLLDNWPLLLGVVIALALLILLALVLLLRKAAKVSHVSDDPDDDEEESEPAAGKPADGSARIGAAFRRARGHLRQRGAGDRYATPLVVVLGAEGSREPRFLEHAGAGLEAREDPVRAGMAFGEGQEFLLFDKGVVLDIAGEPVLGPDGRSADERSWKSIVRQLVEMRPKRPLDAIVVTVGCKELLDAAGDEAKRLALADRADRVRKRLWELQDTSGFRLPLYVLVTSCEQLDGFDDTCAALPARERVQILGWSSPHGAQVPYQTTWIEEAFRGLRGALGHLQMKLFRDAPRGEGVLLLPWSVAALAVPLRTFLDQLLSPGARHEAALTRGIYFCGHDRETRTTAFVAELFGQKIFHETGLATPTSAIRMTRSRRARVLRFLTIGTAAAVAAGLVFAQQTLSDRHQLLQDALQKSFQDMRAMPTMTDGQLGNAGAKLVDRISAVAFEHYSPWWLPASWLSGFDRREHQALGHAFEVIVLNAIYERIDLRANSVIQSFRSDAAMRIKPPDDAGAAEASLEPVEKSEELLVLKKFVADLREIERQGTMFNRVAAIGSHDEAALAANVQFAFDKELPPRFYRQAGMYGLAERGLPPEALFHPDRYQKDATEAAEIGMAVLFSKFFEHNPMAARVGLVAHGIDPKSLQLAGRNELDTAAVQRLDNTFHVLQKDLSTPADAWAFRSSFDLGADLNQTLDSIGRSDMFRPGTEKILRDGGASQLQALQARLGARTGIDTPVLKLRADRTPVMELSHDSDLLHTAIETFLGQSFVVRQTEAHPIRTSVEGRRLVWDPSQLEQAAIAYRAYKDFGERGMKLFPRDFPLEAAAAIAQTAQQRTREQLADLLGQAQRFEPVARPLTAAANEEELRLETAAFDSAAKTIHAQLDALRSLRAEETRNEVIAATSAEAMRLLRAVDDLLKRSAAYRPRTGNFEWWDGTAPPAPSGWGGRDAAQLAEYLDTTRGRVAALANGYAAPMLAWFAEFGAPSGDDDARVVAQWRTISNDLHNFEAKKPGNAPAMLEDYIAERAAKVTPADCRGAELKPGERAARGYFADTLRELAGSLASRCAGVAAARAATSYEELARLFNQRLAGRYPFSDEPPKTSEGEADPEDVRRFFRKFDEVRPLFTAAAGDAADDWFQPAQDFAHKMDKVREFFAPFLDPKKALRLPEVNVEAKFRVLPERESEANEIVRWSLAIGNDTAPPRDKAKPLLWRPGTPVRLTLWWAADAPRVPVVAGRQRNVSVDDRAVVFQYSNRWALLAAVADLRAHAGDLPGGTDELPVTLALNVLTKPAAGGEPDVRHPSLLFLRLALSSIDGQPLDVPPFPAQAPVLKRITAEVSP